MRLLRDTLPVRFRRSRRARRSRRLRWPRRAVLLTGMLAGYLACRGGPTDWPVVYDFVEHFPATAASVPASVSATDGVMTIPVGSAVDYFLDAPAESAITFTGPGANGAGGAKLLVVVEPDGQREQIRAELPSAQATQVVSLGLERPALVRISFRAESARDGAAAGSGSAGLTLRDPVLRAREVASPPVTRASAPAAEYRRSTNVIIYLVDTLRADRLGCYGYPGEISPNIDAFARDAVLFRRAMAQSPWTKPSVASILTGVGPAAHGANDSLEILSEDNVTLAETLRVAGMPTVAFVGNANVSSEFGFRQGFDHFVLFPPGGSKGERMLAPSERVGRRVLPWLGRQTDGRPFFLYVHTTDPHEPYEPPRRERELHAPDVVDPTVGSLEVVKQLKLGKTPEGVRLDDLVALYAAEVATNDRTFGLFVERLKELDLYDDSLIIFLSDHGEEFREHGVWGHARDLYGEVLDLPLIVKFPVREGWGGRRVEALAQHIDIVPTVLGYLGLPAPSGVEGRNLVPLVTSDGEWEGEGVAHLRLFDRSQAAAVSGPWKLIRDYGPDGGAELYDRSRDPRERINLIEERSVVAGYLDMMIRRSRLAGSKQEAPALEALDPQTKENLRLLGYVE